MTIFHVLDRDMYNLFNMNAMSLGEFVRARVRILSGFENKQDKM